MDLPRYEPGGTYAVSGRLLNDIGDAIRANRLLEAAGYLVDRSPQGQRLRLGAALAAPASWDIVSAPTETTTHALYLPAAYRYAAAPGLPVAVPIAGGAFTPQAAHWLVARVETLGSAEIEIVTVADGSMDKVWHFTGSADEFDRADLPLYRFFGSADDGRFQVAPDVWAERFVAPGPRRLVFPLVQVPSTTRWRTVPDLL